MKSINLFWPSFVFTSIVILVIFWVFFVPPYNTPEFQTLENNETGFLVPLNVEDDSVEGRKKLKDSMEILKAGKVSVQRVQIPKEWVQTGWLYTTGFYQHKKRLVKVVRSTVKTDWSAEDKEQDQIKAQSKDGLAFSCNYSATAFIDEKDDGTEKFLYYYKGDALAHIMDSEMRTRVSSITTDFASKFDFEKLRGTQHDLVEAVREDVIPFFKERGIIITKLGMSGGFHPDSKEVQASIDSAITAQQLKITAQAKQEQEKVQQQTKLLNQEIDNKTLLLKADGIAKAAIAAAEGEAKARLAAVNVEIETAKAKALAIKTEADAEAYRYQVLEKSKDLILSLKQLEMESAWRARWTGGVPTTIMNGGTTIPVFPFPTTNDSKK